MANEAERESWGGPVGGAWVRRQADLDAMMAGVTALLMDRAGLRPGMAVLDVGCGTGESSLAAWDRVRPGGRVVGFDVAAPLLALARERGAGREGVAFAEGDAQVDRAPGAPFDAMVSRFGAMFFDDPVAAFRNLAAQLRPGARMTMVAWAAAAENPWLALSHRAAEARLGPAPPPASPDAPGPTAFRDAGRVTGILRAAGLADATGEACDVELHHPGGSAALASLAVEVGPAARMLRIKDASPEDRAAVERDVAAAFVPFDGPDGARVPGRVMLYAARVP